MVVLSIFTCPTGLPQRRTAENNAMTSWRWLTPCPVIRDVGYAKKDAWGTPVVPAVFREGENTTYTNVVAYVNTDIVLTQSFMRAVKAVVSQFEGSFLMIGQRYDLNLAEPLIFEKWWQNRLKERVEKEGVLHQDAGIDYLVYRRGTWGTIPPFALGRYAWDNWLVWRALDLGWPVIDATEVVLAVHQNHDNSHRGEHAEEQRTYNHWLVQLSGGQLCRIRDATHRLTSRFKIVSNDINNH